MQPLDDLLPAEMDAQNEEVLACLRQSYDKADIIAVDPEPQYKALALAAVRQRLLEAQQVQLAQSATIHLLAPAKPVQAPDLPAKSEAKTVNKHRWGRGISLIAATLCVALLVGSLLTVFGLLKRNASTQTSTASGTRALYVITTGWLQKIDATTGTQLWQVQLPYQKGSYDIPMNFPLVGNGAVYVTADNTLLAFNATDGRELWSVKLKDGSADAGGELIQPVLARGRLYYGLQVYAKNSNRAWMLLEAFDASSGQLLWQYNPTKMIDGLVVGDDTAYVTFDDMDGNASQRNLVALNAADGSVKWSVKTDGGNVQAAGILNADSDLVLQDGVIYQFLSSVKDGNCMYAYQAGNGAVLWHSQHLLSTSFARTRDMFWFEGSLIIAGSALYIDSNNGLYAIDAHNGQLLWNQPEGGLLTSNPANHPLSQPFAGKGNPGNAFVVAGYTIYRMEMTDQGNYLTTLNTSSGKIVARHRVESFYSSLSAQIAVDTKQYRGSLQFEGLMTNTTSYVFPSVGRLDALDNQTGARLWSIQLAGGGSAVLMQAP